MKQFFQPGDLIRDKYCVVSILGQGGIATTYQAESKTDGELVAIKVLFLHQMMDWKTLELFEREAKVLASLKHPKIPRYIDYFSSDYGDSQVFCLVQELIPGKSLDSLVKEGHYFLEAEVKDIALQTLTILNYLHQLDPPIVHRDIKPHNIIRTDRGEIYLVDLGAVQDVYRNTMTRSGTFVGTIDYMPPEQMRGQASFASDLYSLGCTTIYLLTRRPLSELPLQRMKLDFSDRLTIAPQLADWLSIAIEPAVENRFKSTRQAIKLLKGRNRFKSDRNEQNIIFGSKVKLQRSKEKLSIRIPALIAQNYGTAKYLRFVIPIVSFLIPALLFHTVLAISTGTLWSQIGYSKLTFATGGAISLISFVAGVYYVFEQRHLIINSHEFRFYSSAFGNVDNIIRGRSKDLCWVVRQSNKIIDEYNIIVHSCQIKIADRYYHFGTWLTEVEQEWLVGEISSFINQVNYREDLISNTRLEYNHSSNAIVDDWISTRQTLTQQALPDDRPPELNKIDSVPLQTVSKLTKNRDCLTIAIPSRIAAKPSLVSLLISISIPACCGFALIGSGSSVIFNATLTIVLLAIALYLIAEYYGTSYCLKFTADTFVLESRSWTGKHCLRGQINRIQEIGSIADSPIDRHGIISLSQHSTCSIVGKGINYKFGNSLSKFEQRWLISEISFFLDRHRV